MRKKQLLSANLTSKREEAHSHSLSLSYFSRSSFSFFSEIGGALPMTLHFHQVITEEVSANSCRGFVSLVVGRKKRMNKQMHGKLWAAKHETLNSLEWFLK